MDEAFNHLPALWTIEALWYIKDELNKPLNEPHDSADVSRHCIALDSWDKASLRKGLDNCDDLIAAIHEAQPWYIEYHQDTRDFFGIAPRTDDETAVEKEAREAAEAPKVEEMKVEWNKIKDGEFDRDLIEEDEGEEDEEEVEEEVDGEPTEATKPTKKRKADEFTTAAASSSSTTGSAAPKQKKGRGTQWLQQSQPHHHRHRQNVNINHALMHTMPWSYHCVMTCAAVVRYQMRSYTTDDTQTRALAEFEPNDNCRMLLMSKRNKPSR